MIIEQQPTGTAALADENASAAAIDRLLRRSLLMLARDAATVQDKIDFASLADAVSASDAAEVARAAAMLRQGFRDAQADIPAPHSSIARAVAELRAIMATTPGHAVAARVEAVDPIAACLLLTRLLAAPLDRDNEETLAGLLAAWRGLADADPVGGGQHVDEALSGLISAFATFELQAFLNRNHALAFAPSGSARLLHHSARLAPGGLGPYFSGVANIVRGAEDVLGLIALAAGNDAQAMVALWVVPLAHSLPEGTTIALADELADLGLVGAIRGLLHMAVRRTDRVGLIRCLRDAALDLGDEMLALSAQEAVIARAPFDVVEWRCLAAMLATAKAAEAAEAALDYAAKLSPDDAHIQTDLVSVKAGNLAEIAIDGGFGTPLRRKKIRSARRLA